MPREAEPVVPKTLLIVHPSARLNGDAYKKLREAGYVVVRGEPSAFHIVRQELPSDALLRAAALAIKQSYSDAPRTHFGLAVVDAILAQAPETPNAK